MLKGDTHRRHRTLRGGYGVGKDKRWNLRVAWDELVDAEYTGHRAHHCTAYKPQVTGHARWDTHTHKFGQAYSIYTQCPWRKSYTFIVTETHMLTHIQQPPAPNTSCFIAHWHFLPFSSFCLGFPRCLERARTHKHKKTEKMIYIQKAQTYYTNMLFVLNSTE